MTVVPEIGIHPQSFIQALLYQAQTFTVSDTTIDLATGQGTVTVPNFGSTITRVVLIVSAYAAETTLLANYHLDISVK